MGSSPAPRLGIVICLCAAALIEGTCVRARGMNDHAHAAHCATHRLALQWRLAAPAMAAALAISLSTTVFAADAGDTPAFAASAGSGQTVFERNCAACHRGGWNVIVSEKTLQQEALEEYLDGGANPAAVMKQVTNGKNAMPAFGGRLSDDDIANVAAYVITTAKTGWD